MPAGGFGIKLKVSLRHVIKVLYSMDKKIHLSAACMAVSFTPSFRATF